MNKIYDVVETANQAGSFRVFVQALVATGLKRTLQKHGPYTIFAPVDDAFVKMPQAKLKYLFKIENREFLKSVLRNHIIDGELLSTDLKRRDETLSIKDEELSIEARARLSVNEALVIAPDLKASNGILHGIDSVLMPQTQVAAP